MDTTHAYEFAAETWHEKVLRLGYTKAYGDFFAGNALTHGAVLDVGTGTGALALSWVEAGGSADLTLLDPSMAMLRQAEARFAQRGLRPALANCGIEAFDPDKKFNAILAAHVLEHFADPSDTLCQLAQRLHPDGRLYLVVSKPHWCNWLIWLRFRHRWFRAERICDMAANAGLISCHLHGFSAGPPSRTSLGYMFSKP